MPLRILIVDDNRDTLMGLAILCRTWGHEVHTASDGARAIDVAQAFVPDAILLDIGLPRMDGFEVTERLRALPDFRSTPIIASSGFNREADLRRAGELGIDHYLVKPFDLSRLESLLAEVGKPVAALSA